MSRSRVLAIDEINGKLVKNVMQTPYEFAADGYGGCRVFVELKDGPSFDLINLEVEAVAPIYEVNIDDHKLLPAEIQGGEADCIGETIVRVVRSDLWPTIGLLLSSNRVLHLHNWYDIHTVGPCLVDVKWFNDGDISDYSY